MGAEHAEVLNGLQAVSEREISWKLVPPPPKSSAIDSVYSLYSTNDGRCLSFTQNAHNLSLFLNLSCSLRYMPHRSCTLHLRVISGVTYAADFLSYCVMVHLLWPSRSLTYSKMHMNIPFDEFAGLTLSLSQESSGLVSPAKPGTPISASSSQTLPS